MTVRHCVVFSEKLPLPVVCITDWYISGDRLFGTAIDHPKAAPNSEVMTSTIVAQDLANNTVTTRNTIYKLEGRDTDDKDN